MRSKALGLVTLIVVVVVLVGVALSCDSGDPLATEAPDFTLNTLTGANVTLSELRGTPVVLNFWSIGCSYCRQQLPYLESVALQAGNQTEVIATNIVDSAASIQTFFGDYEPAMVVALDNSQETFVAYCQNYSNTRGYIPFTLFIDGEGVVQYNRVGAFGSEADLWNSLEDVFGITVP